MTSAGTPSPLPAPAAGRAPRTGHRHRIPAIAAGVIVLAVAVSAAIAGLGGLGRGTPAGTGAGTSAGGASARGAAGAKAGTAAAAAAVTPARCSSGTCWVAVNVATLWVNPAYPRAVDQPALANPADPKRWVASMSVQQKLWLVGKLETQALYGTKVTVIGHSGTAWTKVAVPSQPSNRDKRGYPGWVPTRQLTSTAPRTAGTTAVVMSQTAWLWSRWTGGGVAGSHVLQVSYDTRLPVVRSTSAYVEVTMIGGRNVALRRSVVALHAAGASWGATRAKVVAEARKFLGLQYLWAGTSGFGYDCSGFTYSVYHASGVTLPRDADRQAVHGTAVARASLLPGDLVFYRGSPGGAIGHVGMYVGGGNMINAPQTGVPVRIEPVSGYSYYAGARRFLTR
jgi:cell wall-associated NlpC family hydrolase